MNQYFIELKKIIDVPWTVMDSICIGDVPKTLGTPDFYCIVEKEWNPYLVVKIYLDYQTSFTKAVVWNNYIAIGFSESFFLIDLENHSCSNTLLDGYFGYIYPYDNFLLVATQTNLVCINKQGSQLWITETLGIDGVIVNNFDGVNIYGSGEYDPPGGWVDFEINFRDGKLVK